MPKLYCIIALFPPFLWRIVCVIRCCSIYWILTENEFEERWCYVSWPIEDSRSTKKLLRDLDQSLREVTRHWVKPLIHLPHKYPTTVYLFFSNVRINRNVVAASWHTEYMCNIVLGAQESNVTNYDTCNQWMNKWNSWTEGNLDWLICLYFFIIFATINYSVLNTLIVVVNFYFHLFITFNEGCSI